MIEVGLTIKTVDENRKWIKILIGSTTSHNWFL